VSQHNNNSAPGHAIFQIHMPTPLMSPFLWGIGKRMLNIGCSDADINENKIYKNTFFAETPFTKNVNKQKLPVMDNF
jgi:hypothetical protein